MLRSHKRVNKRNTCLNFSKGDIDFYNCFVSLYTETLYVFLNMLLLKIFIKLSNFLQLNYFLNRIFFFTENRTVKNVCYLCSLRIHTETHTYIKCVCVCVCMYFFMFLYVLYTTILAWLLFYIFVAISYQPHKIVSNNSVWVGQK